MISDYQTYQKFEQQERRFNEFFSTSVAAAISMAIGGVLFNFNFFDNPGSWFVVFILAILPVIVLIIAANGSEFKTAYYKNWQDKLTGWFDKHKVLRRFAKQYGIKSWFLRPQKIEVDKRWRFYVETDYMHRLLEQRDLLFGQIRQEYIDKMTLRDKAAVETNRLLENAKIDLESNTKNGAEIKKFLDAAQSKAEVFKQRQDLSNALLEIDRCKKRKTDAEHLLEDLEKDKDNITQNYQELIMRVANIYHIRYTRYQEVMTGKISRVHGLNYEIADLLNPDMVKIN